MIADNFNPTRSAGVLKQTINGLLNNIDGKADSGSFDLVLSDDIARCTFGLSKSGNLKCLAFGQAAPVKSAGGWISASVSGIRYASATTLNIQVNK